MVRLRVFFRFEISLDISFNYDDKEGLCRAAIEDASDRIFANFYGVIDESQDPWTQIEIWLETHSRELELVHKMVKASMDLRTVSTQCVETDEVRRVVSTFLDGAMVCSIIRRDFDLRRTIATFRDVLWCYLVPDSKERPVSRS